jgi:hypothetical protein
VVEVIVIDDGRGGPLGVEPSWRERVHARTDAGRLDGDLAAGVSPDATALLALRSRYLTRMSTRRALARSAKNLLGAATLPDLWSRGHVVPVARTNITAAAAEISALAARLVQPGLVAPRGVARATRLLSQAWGPELSRHGAEQFRREVSATIDCLNPLSSF